MQSSLPCPRRLVSILACVPMLVPAAADPSAKLERTVAIPFDFYGGQVFLQVRVNGSEALPFALDSGASGCVVDIGRCAALGLRPEGSKQGTGAGAGTVEMKFLHDVAFEVGGIETRVPQAYAIDLSGQLASVGRDMAGILGYDFIEPYVVEVDYDSRVLRLHDPEGYTYAGPGEVLPITLEKKVPHVVAQLAVAGHEPVSRKLLLDSGSSDGVDDSLIASSSGPKFEVTGGVGLGREFGILLGRFESVRLGKLGLENVYGGTGGGLIGSEVLHRFTVIFDYRRQRVILEPNRHYHDEFAMDASGLDLRLEPTSKCFQVHTVLQGSPAASAGIQPGDVLTAIDGRPASELHLEQVQTLFQHAGREYRLGIVRGKTSREATIRTRQLL